MKSLEIIYFYLEVAEKMEEDKYKDALKNTLNQVKQDLEVLEIIKNKNVNLKDLKHTLQGFKKGVFTTMEDVLVAYNLFVIRENELTMEELLKIKQWLEEN